MDDDFDDPELEELRRGETGGQYISTKNEDGDHSFDRDSDGEPGHPQSKGRKRRGQIWAEYTSMGEDSDRFLESHKDSDEAPDDSPSRQILTEYTPRNKEDSDFSLEV